MAGSWDKMPSCRLGTNYAIASSTGGAVATSAISGQIYQVRVATLAAAFVKVGDGTPVAGVTDALLPANQVDYFTCTPGQKVSVLGTGAASQTTVTEMS
jgi:hypothetical protein